MLSNMWYALILMIQMINTKADLIDFADINFKIIQNGQIVKSLTFDGRVRSGYFQDGSKNTIGHFDSAYSDQNVYIITDIDGGQNIINFSDIINQIDSNWDTLINEEVNLNNEEGEAWNILKEDNTLILNSENSNFTILAVVKS